MRSAPINLYFQSHIRSTWEINDPMSNRTLGNRTLRRENCNSLGYCDDEPAVTHVHHMTNQDYKKENSINA